MFQFQYFSLLVLGFPTHPVLVAVEHVYPVGLERVPQVDGVVVVPGKEDPPAGGEVHGVDAEEDRLLRVLGHLAVSAQVEQPEEEKGVN